MKVVCGILAAVASVQALTVEESHIGMFNNWKAEHGKTYASIDHETARFQVFMNNYHKIESHMQNAERTYDMKVNHFADLTAEEFKSQMTGYIHTKGRKSTADYVHSVTSEAPASMDWRAKGKVTAVKNQGQCGSCWAFSTTGSVEAANLIQNGGDATDAVDILSEQQLVDCSSANNGCNGGLMDYGFEYIKGLGATGDDTESSYSYTASDGSCKAKTGTPSNVKVTGYVDVTSGSEEALRHAVGTVGPVSIAIEADQHAFQFYSGGVLSSGCGQQLDHGVLVVGYTDDYWIVKNSWGPSWGEEGYIRLATGSNMCGIANQPSYPLVAKK